MGVFKLPSSKLTSETLVHAAQGLRTTAAIYKDVFVEHGLPADFLDQLDVATTALKSSVDARGLARSRRTGASTGLSDDLTLGREIVATIDASLTHALKSDSATLASWHQAKRATGKGAVSRGPVAVAPVGGSGASPGVAGESVAVTAASVVVAGVSASGSVVPAASSKVPGASSVELPEGRAVKVSGSPEIRAA
jgi:hypothetical protein